MKSFTPISMSWDRKHWDWAILSFDRGKGWRSLLRIIVFFGEGFVVHVLFNWNWKVDVALWPTIRDLWTRCRVSLGGFLGHLVFLVKKIEPIKRLRACCQHVRRKLSTFCQRLHHFFVNCHRCLRWTRIKWKRWWLHYEHEMKNTKWEHDPFDHWNRDLFPILIFGLLFIRFLFLSTTAWAPTMEERRISVAELQAQYVPPEVPLHPELAKILAERDAEWQAWLDYLEINDDHVQRIPVEHRVMIARFTYDNDVPLEIVVNLIQKESEWYPRARSRPNANGSRDEGLMQLNTLSQPYFIKNFYTGTQEFDPFDPRHNVECGVKYLRALRDTMGSWTRAVMAYNCGSSRVVRNEVPESTKVYARIVLGDDLNRI